MNWILHGAAGCAEYIFSAVGCNVKCTLVEQLLKGNEILGGKVAKDPLKIGSLR